MAANKKDTYVGEELSWLEARAEEIKQEVESNPYHKIEDRVVTLRTANGFNEKVSATAEAQKKAQRDALKDYAMLIEQIDKMREKDDKKIEARGKEKLTPEQEKWLNARK